MGRVRNFISFDLEFWYDSEFIKDKKKASEENDLIVESVNRIKRILNAHNTKATFFVTGKIMEKYPNIIKDLSQNGHEIASHGYSHTMLNELGRDDFEKEMELSREMIKKITGENPRGFRAPSWSISKDEFWAYKILDNLGFKYSSSLFPVNMGLYGSSKFPVLPFKPLENSNLIEIPISPFEVANTRIPFSGGVYFRILPKKLISFFMKKMNERGKSVFLYLHPWEFCPEIPKVKTSLVGKITTYYGVKNNEKKLDYILSNFDFCPFKTIFLSDKNL
ncbi:MAG: polysaccharide deacetylase family protein [Candidatus Nanoarchaeia archaeon]|nr:polysaccharide deacetylase family protein [Candidatus Nanoarchaeia archaeon]MDD5358162.1 polysaccharide deacetylase family protein [Candidatus Nanoarchaeia archaeon]MDD5589349.1 polysaccharide deacetylase family protein [Candidatus Nanoarchaeia archaeon]